MAVGFVLLGFLAACSPEATNLNKEAMPSASPTPSSSPSQLASPIPSAPAIPSETSVVPTATSTPALSPTSLAPGRCTLGGELTYEHIVPREVIETNHEFNFKDIQAARFMCHSSNDDTLIITNQKEVLSFDPKTLKVETLIDENLTGFSSDQGSKFRFQNIRECIVDKQGSLYIENGNPSEVYRVDWSNKRITTLQYTPYRSVSPTASFQSQIRFALTPQKQVLVADSVSLFEIDGSSLIRLFRADPGNKAFSTGVTRSQFPQRLNTDLAIEEVDYINGIATDSKGNIYLANPHQRVLLKLTPEKKVFLVNPAANNLLYSEGSQVLASKVNSFEYAPKYRVFFGRGPVVITRDGCEHILSPEQDSEDNIPGSSYISDIASTNDGSVYIFDSRKMRISRLEIPPDLPEKAQWEPPQAWKDATGME